MGHTNVVRTDFEIRHHQIEIEVAVELQITDLLKEGHQERDGIPISKSDIILIFALYKGGMIEFFDLYKQYVTDCRERRWKACDKPHWFLKRLCD